MIVDLERCIGCKSCEAACKQEHGLGPGEFRNKVVWLGEAGQAASNVTGLPACVPVLRLPYPRTGRQGWCKSMNPVALDVENAS